MLGKSVLTRLMSGVAVGGAALLMTSPSASAFDPDLSTASEHKKDECFVTGTLTVARFDVDVQILVVFSDLAAGVEANVTLFCSTPRSNPSAIVFLNTENNLIVPLELVYPGIDTLFGELFTRHGTASKTGLHKSDHKAKEGLGFVYQGTAGLTIETGTDPFELEDRVDALQAQDTVVVKADGTTGTLDVRGVLIQGTIGAP